MGALDDIAFVSCATSEQAKIIAANRKKKEGEKNKKKEKKKVNDKKKSSKSSGKPKPRSLSHQGRMSTDANPQKSPNRSSYNSTIDSHQYSKDEVSREDDSSARLLSIPRPSTVPSSHRSKPKVQPKKTTTRSALKDFGRQLFGAAHSKSPKKDSSHKIPGKCIDTPLGSRRPSSARSRSHGRSARPRTPVPTIHEAPEEEEGEFGLNPNFDTSRIRKWIDTVDQESSLGASGVVLSDEGGQGLNEDGYRMSDYPMRSDFGGSQTDDGRPCSVRSSAIVPDDSATQGGRRRRRRH